MHRVFCAVVFSLICGAAWAADIGAIVMHGKWGSPDQHVDGVAAALAKQGYLVVSPEMPWSKRRNYDRSVEDADAEVDGQIEKLKAAGAKRIVLVGHSLGAAYALHYGTRSAVDAIVAIAPGHRPEAPRIAESFADDVKRARDLIAAGKPSEILTFTDFNGGRRSRMTATAASFASYFDPAGPMNFGRNAESLKPVPVLWLVPTREERPLREGNLAVYRRLPQHPSTQLAEPAADHLGAPEASVPTVIEWLKKALP